MQTQATKPCSKCSEIKPLDCFNKNNKTKSGVTCQCKSCIAAGRQSEKAKATRKLYKLTNKVRSQAQAYRQSDAGKAIRKAYNQSEKGRACAKAYSQSSKRKASTKAYGKAEHSKAVKKDYYQSNQKKIAAHRIINKAVRLGCIIKPNDCSECGYLPNKLEGHHDDYSKPLVVRWLCMPCHRSWHDENGAGLNG